MSGSPMKQDSNFFLWKILNVLEKFFCIVPVIVMTVVVFVSIIFRYVLKAPLGWAEEFTKCCMVWCIMGGASFAFYTGLNVGVTFAVDRLPAKARKYADLVIYALTIVFMAILLYTGTQMFISGIGKATLAAKIPLVIPYASIPVGCVMSILRLLELISMRIKAPAEETV